MEEIFSVFIDKPWTAGFRDTTSPTSRHSQKSAYNFWLLKHLVIPWHNGRLVPGLPQIPKSRNAQIPYMKWHEQYIWLALCTRSFPISDEKYCPLICGWLNRRMWNPQILRAKCIFSKKEKKESRCKWTHAVLIHVVQWSTVFVFSILFWLLLLSSLCHV